MKKKLLIIISILTCAALLIVIQYLNKTTVTPMERHFLEEVVDNDASENVSPTGEVVVVDDYSDRVFIRKNKPKRKDYIVDGIAEFECSPYFGTRINVKVSEYYLVEEEELVSSMDSIEFLDADNFYKPIDPNREVSYFDYKRLKQERPELYDYLSNKCDESKRKELAKEWGKVSDSYNLMRHPKTIYLFLKCSFTNLGGNSVDITLSSFTLLGYHDDQLIVQDGEMYYFDRSQHVADSLEREHSFFTYSMEKYETLDCYIGYIIYSWDNYVDVSIEDDIYFGLFENNSLTEKYGYEFGDHMFRVKDINNYEK